MRLLLVEDNLQLADWLSRTLRRQKYTVDCVSTGRDADHVLQTEVYDLVVLDLTLPDQSGLEILRRLRARRNDVPVVILTASDTLEARVAGLNSGADDYLSKPFEIAELEARIRAQLRRANSSRNPLVHFGALAYDSNTRRFTVGEQDLSPTAREHAVL
jgi:two-component system response regulator TctD